MKSKWLIAALLMDFGFDLRAQIDSTLLRPMAAEQSDSARMNLDAIYARPFMQVGRSPVNIGGYLEVKAEHLGTDGVNEGTQFQMQRLTLFVASAITERISFLSEIEFEHGTEEIGIEFASLDLELDPLLTLRGGIVMNPIGAFNQNHDGPRWEFTDRPISASAMLPATWSNVGFGAFGKKGMGRWSVAYEAYLTNGFNDRIIANSDDRTSLPAAKEDPERFAESFNGVPLVTAKLATKRAGWGEVGLSWMGGVYNKFQDDGLELDVRRRVDVFAIDVQTDLQGIGTDVIGEWAWVLVDVPGSYTQQYGTRQQGGYLDIVQPIVQRRILGFDGAVLNLACRMEHVDWNVGRFQETGGDIGDAVWAVVPALSFRPVPGTVIRLNYRHHEQRDLLGDPPSRTGGFQFGISSYF
ncbi:MAG: hypothetical protein ABI432_11780 [Flavobacteriales bacterium]